MSFSSLDRIYCFSLGDFHTYEKCHLDFLVKHHLQKKYEIAEGSEKLALGTLLDLAIKKLHMSRAYTQPLDYLLSALFKAAENDVREQAAREGKNSFYGETVKFLTPEVFKKAQDVFKNYYEKRDGKINRAILNKRFWECLIEGEKSLNGSSSQLLKIWGGPDTLELGDDGVPEIVDYKYFEDPQKGREGLDMDLMPKLYTLLCAPELLKSGYKKARFRVRSWTDPLDESLYEEFDLQFASNLKDFFKVKINQILAQTELKFCEKPYCKSCNHELKEEWIKLLKEKKFIQV